MQSIISDTEIIDSIQQALVKIEGTIGILKNTPQVSAYRRAQGAKDALVNLAKRVAAKSTMGDISSAISKAIDGKYIFEEKK